MTARDTDPRGTVLTKRQDRGVATLWLDRAPQHNALSPEMLTALTQAAQELAKDRSVRVVVLAGRGASFCAGGDLGWMQAQANMDGATRRAESARLAHAFGALYDLPQPLIGRVQGNALGGGMGLISVCDHVIAAQSARFGLTEVKLGLIPANIGPYVVARMGAPSARRIFTNARLFDAAEAAELNLIDRAVPDGELDNAIESEIAQYLTCAPNAVREAKALLRQLAGPVRNEDVEMATEALAKCWETEEARQGIAAFFATRR